MKNISIITSIVAIKDGVPAEINYTQQSASLSIADKRTSQGVLRDHSLKFNIAGITIENRVQIQWLHIADTITVTDAGGAKFNIGTDEFKPKIEVEAINDGSAGGFRGFAVAVQWQSLG